MHMGLPEQPASRHEEEILDAALLCFGRFGVGKTTLEDIASASGVSRATIYRTFAGKDHIAMAVLDREVCRLFSTLDERLLHAETVRDVIVESLVTAAECLGSHRVLHMLIETEPELVLPHVVLGSSVAVSTASGFLAPRLAACGLTDPSPAEVAEWVTHFCFSHLIRPGSLSLSDRAQVSAAVDRLFLPALSLEVSHV
jgi:AcrR family transcriptional regulator